MGRQGGRCALRDLRERIRPDELEYELQFGQEGATPDVDLFHLHLRCFAAWEAWEMERTKAASGSDTP
jgi:hypothetical protein